MVRWPIIRTLLYKEALRYRYNWGLLVMIAALLAMSALISISARMNQLPGQQDAAIHVCAIAVPYSRDAEQYKRAMAWAQHLRRHAAPDIRVWYDSFPEGWRMDPAWVQPNVVLIELIAPSANSASSAPWTARYWYAEKAEGLLPLRDWFVRESHRFLGVEPSFIEESRQGGGNDTRVPLIITALTIFAVYLLSFNLYITSSGEEREKRVLLGLLLSPASPAEFIIAKAIFYVSASLVVSMAVVCMYDPRLLSRPLLWCAVMSGSVGYIAIGTVVLTLVRRQTTLSIVSMVYLIATSMIMFLSQFLPLFGWLRWVLVEDYLYRELQQIIAREPIWWAAQWLNQLFLGFLVLIWSVAAIETFRRQGMAIARGR